MRFRSGLAAIALLTLLTGRASSALVNITSDEVWDGVTNPHQADGVTLTFDAGTSTATYNIPNGMTIGANAEIFIWDIVNPATTKSIVFNFAPGGGGLLFAGTEGVFDTTNQDYTGSAIDVYCGSRSCGGNRSFTLNMNNNNITNGGAKAGVIYNSTSQLQGTTGSAPAVVINSDANVTMGHIVPATYDAGGGAIDLRIGGTFDVYDLKTDDPTGGGGSADSLNVRAGAVILRGAVDTTAKRPDGNANNATVNISALKGPEFSPGNAGGNTVATNVLTMATGSSIVTDVPLLNNQGGNINLTGAKVVLESGTTITVSQGATLSVKHGVVAGPFTLGQVFVNNSGQSITGLPEVFHDNFGLPAVAYTTGRDWRADGTWTPQSAPTINSVVAEFGAAVSSARTIYVDADTLVKGIRFSTANKVAVAGVGTLSLDANTGNAELTSTLGSHEFQVRFALQDNTDANISGGSTVEFNNSLTLNGKTLTKTGGGTLNINNRLTTGGGSIVNNGGTIGGGGAIGGDLVNSSGGTVSPGTSPGMLTVTGNYTQQAGSSLRIELGGTQRTQQYDVLNVLGSATLGGSLDVVLIDGFTPTDGQSFDILDFGSVSGNFSAVNLPAGVTWNTTNLLTTGTLQVGGGTQITGDFDGDGDADGDDFAAWSTNFGRTGGATRAQGNSDGDGDVDGVDFLTWQSRFGRTSGAAGAVPEPTTLVLSLVSGLFVARRRR